MRWLTPNPTWRVRRLLLIFLAISLLVTCLQRYSPSLEYLAYRWHGGVANVNGLRINVAPGWYPYPKSVRHDHSTSQVFVKIRSLWLPSDPRARYEAVLYVNYEPQRNLSQADILRLMVGCKHMSWGEFWLVSDQPQAAVEPSMAWALSGGQLSVGFNRLEDLDAVESVTVP